MENINIILEELKKVEGDILHYNNGEDDITAPYGILRSEHPEASIFKYIDIVAEENGFTDESKLWNKEVIKVINDMLDKDVIKDLVIEFYKEFLLKVNLHKFTEHNLIAAVSLYTNSPRRMWKSVQSTINKFNSNTWIDYEKQLVDGYYGKNTSDGLDLIGNIVEENDIYGYLFEALMVSHMQLEYAKLVVSNPDKYLEFLNGWNNRVTSLLED